MAENEEVTVLVTGFAVGTHQTVFGLGIEPSANG